MNGPRCEVTDRCTLTAYVQMGIRSQPDTTRRTCRRHAATLINEYVHVRRSDDVHVRSIPWEG
jgi:hypothetical protein